MRCGSVWIREAKIDSAESKSVGSVSWRSFERLKGSEVRVMKACLCCDRREEPVVFLGNGYAGRHLRALSIVHEARRLLGTVLGLYTARISTS